MSSTKTACQHLVIMTRVMSIELGPGSKPEPEDAIAATHTRTTFVFVLPVSEFLYFNEHTCYAK